MAKKGRGALVVFIIILFLLIFASLAIAFNIGGLKDLAFSIIGKEPSRQTVATKSIKEVELEREKEFIDAEKTKLSALRTDLENYKVQLGDREKEIEDKEAQLFEKEQQVERLNEKLSGKFEDLMELIKIYDKMDGEEAAAILSQIEDTDQVLLIIKNLKKEKSAEILGLMDAKRAADILNKMY